MLLFYVRPKITSFYIFLLTEKGFGFHQLQIGFGDEIWQILLGLQTNLEDFASRQSKIGIDCHQYPCLEVRLRINVSLWKTAYQPDWDCKSYKCKLCYRNHMESCETEKYVSLKITGFFYWDLSVGCMWSSTHKYST